VHTAERARKLAFCETVWAATRPAVNSPVESYLRLRGIIGPIPDSIRFHATAPLDYEGRSRSAAMVALVTPCNGLPACGLHLTAILSDGSAKADLAHPRRMFGEIAGAVVHLASPVNGELAVAEGLETALSYRDLTGTPTWAALSTAGFASFLPPHGLKRLIIAADGDSAGVKAARELAERASRRCECIVHSAPDGWDWNDATNGRGQ
jgi:putative DNA primase/helicase